jgi:hypothetical protein
MYCKSIQHRTKIECTVTVQKDLVKLNLLRGVEMTILKKYILFITKLY